MIIIITYFSFIFIVKNIINLLNCIRFENENHLWSLMQLWTSAVLAVWASRRMRILNSHSVFGRDLVVGTRLVGIRPLLSTVPEKLLAANRRYGYVIRSFSSFRPLDVICHLFRLPNPVNGCIRTRRRFPFFVRRSSRIHQRAQTNRRPSRLAFFLRAIAFQVRRHCLFVCLRSCRYVDHVLFRSAHRM